jgi:exodeoxyribonuclease V
MIKLPTGESLSEDQAAAWAKLIKWLPNTNSRFFELKGYAGTGKSFLMKMLTTLPSINLLLTAPTNKAAKVLADFTNRPTTTTYSLLGLRMQSEESMMVLKVPDVPVYLGQKPIVLIDESSMIPEVLIKAALSVPDTRYIFVGDPAQLPPVGEEYSTVWDMATKEDRAMLRQVMRFDNELLDLSVEIRRCLAAKDYSTSSPLPKESSKQIRVHSGTRSSFMTAIVKASGGEASYFDTRKVLAWTNKVCAQYNDALRESFGFTKRFAVGERLLLASPIKSANKIVATIDTELTVLKANLTSHSVTYKLGNTLSNTENFKCWRLETNLETVPELLVIENEAALQRTLTILSGYASRQKSTWQRKKAWEEFWNVKESFQSVRYNYAITCHRSQGSTYESVFIDQQDILRNPDKFEAYRCLYVAATRPSNKLYTF